MDVVMLLNFEKAEKMHWFEKFLTLNAAGMIDYMTPIEYQYNQVVFVSMFVSIGYDDHNWSVFLSKMKLR